MSYSEINPLIIPKILTKPVFAKEFTLEKAAPKEEEDEVQRTALEEELRQTLNDLDLALNSQDVRHIIINLNLTFIIEI